MPKKTLIVISVLALFGLIVVKPAFSEAEAKFVMGTSPSYIDGKFSQGLAIGQNDVPYYEFSGHDGLNPEQGTIEVWVKPTDWLSSSAGYWEIVSGVDQ